MASNKFLAIFDRLDNFGKVLSSIRVAMQTVKQMRQNGSEMNKVIERAKTTAAAVSDLQYPDEPMLIEAKKLVQPLKQATRNMCDSLTKLEVYVDIFNKEVCFIDEPDGKTESDDWDMPENMATFGKELQKICRSTLDLNEAWNLFAKEYKTVKTLVDQLKSQNLLLNRELYDQNRSAVDQVNMTIVFGCFLGLLLLVILLLVYFGVSGFIIAVCVAGILICASFFANMYYEATARVEKTSKLMNCVSCEHDKLSFDNKDFSESLFAVNPNNQFDTMAAINLNETALKSLESVFELFKKETMRAKTYAESETKLAEKDAQLTAMKSEVSELRAKLQALGSYTSAAASLTTMHSVEHFRGALQQRPQLEATRSDRRYRGRPNQNYYGNDQQD